MHVIKGVGYILCAAALWAYTNEPDLLPSTLKKRIQKFEAHLLPVKRIQVVAEDDEFIDYDEEANRAAAQSDERKLLGKLLTGQESLKRKLYILKF